MMHGQKNIKLPQDVAVIMKWSIGIYASVGVTVSYFTDNIYQSFS